MSDTTVVDFTRERLIRIEDKIDLILTKMGEMVIRTSLLEQGQAALNNRLDHVDQRLGRIEARLELREQ